MTGYTCNTTETGTRKGCLLLYRLSVAAGPGIRLHDDQRRPHNVARRLRLAQHVCPKTAERLGFVGREEGIATTAVALIERQ